MMPHKGKENPRMFLSTCISIGSKFPIPCGLVSHEDNTVK